jgi:hypothetical protein
VLTAPVLGADLTVNVRADREAEREKLIHEVALETSSRTLATLIATTHGISMDDVIRANEVIPHNLRPLLGTPQGWTMLADLIAAAAQVEPRPVMPTSH